MFYSTGINYYHLDWKTKTQHAEVNAALGLKPNHENKKKKVIVLILRTNSDGTKLLMSKPCNNCIWSLKTILDKKGYKFKAGWYTDNDGCFQKFGLF